MGHLSTDIAPRPPGEAVPSKTGSTSHRWLWIVALVGLVGLGYWYFRGPRASTEAEGPAAPGGSGKGQGRQGAGPGGFVVPVVVSTAQRGDLPVYFNGLGTVTAFNTVTVRSRVDGQLVSVAFKEGQFVHQGDLLAQIDPRPFQVQLEKALGELAKDQAQRKDAEANFERFKLLYAEGVIPKQQMDTQQGKE